MIAVDFLPPCCPKERLCISLKEIIIVTQSNENLGLLRTKGTVVSILLSRISEFARSYCSLYSAQRKAMSFSVAVMLVVVLHLFLV